MAERLKDMFLTPSSIKVFADTIKRFDPGFDKKRFVRLVLDEEFENRELMARMRHITECLRLVTPKSYKKALATLKKVAPHVKGMEGMCLPDYVALYGLDDWDPSLDALTLFTKYSSSEFAIRPFIHKDPRRAMAFMKKAADDSDPKVRRFASEGCRPRLPWAVALPAFKKDPSMILPILEKLKDDKSEFVRNSVANNLNDISKDNPDVVLGVCKKWVGKSKRTDWIIKHACRSMLKAGDSRAMVLFGFSDPKDIKVQKLSLDKKMPAIGDRVQFTFTVQVGGRKACLVRLEYVVYFAKARGRESKKVFKITEKTLTPGEHVVIKRHSFADQSTRVHYPGAHKIGIVVNGVEKNLKSFELTE
jgi:3-methyladenine DNA glycosylase AlkC